MAMLGTEGMVLRGRWTLTEFLARGACAEVWAVSCDAATATFERRDAQTGWVVKLCAEPPFRSAADKKKKRKASPEELAASTISWEHSLYHGILRGHPAVPQVPLRDGYGESFMGLRFLVMERLGPTLMDHFEAQGKRFSPALLADYGRQMLGCLRECHARKLLYGDVKPENFMLRLANPANPASGAAGQVVIADFGVADKFVNSLGAHKPDGVTGGGGGTPAYSSLYTHSGRASSRRDDVEALGYVLCEFSLQGAPLPWVASVTNDDACKKAKASTDLGHLLASAPGGAAVAAFVAVARATAFEAEPDYAAFGALLDDLAAAKSSDTSAASKGAGKGAPSGKVKSPKTSTASPKAVASEQATAATAVTPKAAKIAAPKPRLETPQTTATRGRSKKADEGDTTRGDGLANSPSTKKAKAPKAKNSAVAASLAAALAAKQQLADAAAASAEPPASSPRRKSTRSPGPSGDASSLSEGAAVAEAKRRSLLDSSPAKSKGKSKVQGKSNAQGKAQGKGKKGKRPADSDSDSDVTFEDFAVVEVVAVDSDDDDDDDDAAAAAAAAKTGPAMYVPRTAEASPTKAPTPFRLVVPGKQVNRLGGAKGKPSAEAEAEAKPPSKKGSTRKATKGSAAATAAVLRAASAAAEAEATPEAKPESKASAKACSSQPVSESDEVPCTGATKDAIAWFESAPPPAKSPAFASPKTAHHNTGSPRDGGNGGGGGGAGRSSGFGSGGAGGGTQSPLVRQAERRVTKKFKGEGGNEGGIGLLSPSSGGGGGGGFLDAAARALGIL